jgi:acetyl esterase/lipase
MHSRRDILKLGAAAGLMLGVSSLAVRSAVAAADPLAFDATSFTELTETISTASGDHEVTYRFWKAIPYVSQPVDVAYQSLNVSLPIRIDGVDIDASKAPILLANSVGGYMPSSVAEATGIGGGGMGGMPPAGGGGGEGAPAEAPSGSAMMVAGGEMVSNAKLALAAGYVVVEPGARGRTLVDADGKYYGVAPAAIVDLKAAVRYLRHNAGVVPGNTEWIVSSGTSAGGALSALLGASGDDPIFADALAAIGAAEASDAIFASGDWCPITDLENADMAYEWNWGGNALQSGELVDQTVSNELKGGFGDYIESLGLVGIEGPLHGDNYSDHLIATYLQPAATQYLAALSDADRATYLAANPGIGWAEGKASFGWAEFLAHVGARKKTVPAFDAFDLSAGENNLFGLDTTEARHFTTYSLRHASGNPEAVLDADLPEKLRQMNPMTFILADNPRRARHWWIRVGTKDTDTALSVVGNLATALGNRGDAVDAAMYWDAGHGANEDADAFIAWIGKATGYKG